MGARWTYVFLVVHLTSLLFMSKGQTCFFTETARQKGSEMLHIDSANTTDVTACKTLCNTTELCIAGEFLSTTNTCHIYLVETNLTDQSETVFFQWDCTHETATTATTTSPTTSMQTTTTTIQLTITTTPTTAMQQTTTTTTTTTTTSAILPTTTSATTTTPVSMATITPTLAINSSGQTCFFMETAGQKGSEMLHSDSANTTDVSACKTLCNTTELCMAGEFLSTTNTCYIYLVETNLTDQTETVFFQWDCTNETATTVTTTASTTTMQPTTTTPTTTMQTTTTTTQPTTTTTSTTTMQPTTTTIQPITTTTSTTITATTSMQPTTTTPTTTTTTSRTTPTTTTTTTTTIASKTTITPTLDSNSSEPQYRTEGAIAAALASFAVLMCIPCLMCIILCRKKKTREDNGHGSSIRDQALENHSRKRYS